MLTASLSDFKVRTRAFQPATRLASSPFRFNDLPTEIALRILALAITTPTKLRTYRSLVRVSRRMQELALHACLPHVPVVLGPLARFESFHTLLDSHPIVRQRIRSVWFAPHAGATTQRTLGLDILQKCSGIARIACNADFLKAFMEASADFAHHNLKDLTLVEPEIILQELLHPPAGRQLFSQLTHLRTARHIDVDFDVDFCFASLTHLSFKCLYFDLSPISTSFSDLTRFPVLQHIVPSLPYLQWRWMQPKMLWDLGRALDGRIDVINCPKKWKELVVWEEGGPGERDLWGRARTTEFLKPDADNNSDDDDVENEDGDDSSDDIYGYT